MDGVVCVPFPAKYSQLTAHRTEQLLTSSDVIAFRRRNIYLFKFCSIEEQSDRMREHYFDFVAQVASSCAPRDVNDIWALIIIIITWIWIWIWHEKCFEYEWQWRHRTNCYRTFLVLFAMLPWTWLRLHYSKWNNFNCKQLPARRDGYSKLAEICRFDLNSTGTERQRVYCELWRPKTTIKFVQ